MILPRMVEKAHKLIAADALAAYRQANPQGAKRHKPYSIPDRSRDLVAALGKGDASAVAAIMLYRFSPGDFEPGQAR